MVNFLFILRYDPFESPTGTQIFGGSLALELARNGHNVKIVFESTHVESNTERPNNVDLHGIQIVGVPYLRALLFRRRCAAVCTQIIRDYPIDAIIGFTGTFPNYTFRKIKENFGHSKRPKCLYYAIDSMLSLYNISKPWIKSISPINRLKTYIYYSNLVKSDREACMESDFVLASSDDTNRQLCSNYGLSNKRIKTLYMGVRDQFGQGIKRSEPDIPNFLHIGGSVYKGTNFFLQAMKLLGEKYNLRAKATITRATKSQMDEAMKTKIDIELHGPISPRDHEIYYARCTALVSPSLREGFCLPVVEAGMFGKPAVVSNGGSLPELVDDGENGFVVPVADSKTLAERMNQFALDQDLRSKMGEKARVRSREFTISKTAARLVSMLSDYSP